MKSFQDRIGAVREEMRDNKTLENFFIAVSSALLDMREEADNERVKSLLQSVLHQVEDLDTGGL